MSRKQRALAILDSLMPGIQDLGQRLFQTPELGFKEYETAALIGQYLSDQGIPYEEGIALTGVRARLGQEGYHIALVADMDALEVQGTQGPFVMHACGHSIQLAIMLAVIHSLHILNKEAPLAGQVSFMATPAEEFLDLDYRRDLIAQGKIAYASGKQNMIAQGFFDQVDSVLSCHVMGESDKSFDVGSSLTGFTVKKVIFQGQAAHSGVAPYEGKNALHAASLCLQAAAFLQQEFAPEAGVRLYPILTQGGLSMNAIPERAVLESYLRANSLEDLFRLRHRFDQIARHSALAMGLGCQIQETVGYLPLVQSDALNEIVYRNMLTLCPPEAIVRKPVSGASGDIGDLARILPTVQFGFSGIQGRVHSQDFRISEPERIYRDPAKVVLGTVMDLLENPTLQLSNPHYEAHKAAYLKDWLGQGQG